MLICIFSFFLMYFFITIVTVDVAVVTAVALDLVVLIVIISFSGNVVVVAVVFITVIPSFGFLESLTDSHRLLNLDACIKYFFEKKKIIQYQRRVERLVLFACCVDREGGVVEQGAETIVAKWVGGQLCHARVLVLATLFAALGSLLVGMVEQALCEIAIDLGQLPLQRDARGVFLGHLLLQLSLLILFVLERIGNCLSLRVKKKT